MDERSATEQEALAYAYGRLDERSRKGCHPAKGWVTSPVFARAVLEAGVSVWDFPEFYNQLAQTDSSMFGQVTTKEPTT
jgi:hypothetical protein